MLSNTWKQGDVITIQLPMEVRRVTANDTLKNDIGKIAIQRGPLMYCAEWVDNNGRTSNIIVPDEVNFISSN